MATTSACAIACSSSTGGSSGSASTPPGPNGGSLELSGQASDAPHVLGTSACNATQNLQLQGLHGSMYRFMITDTKPGILTLASHSSLSIDLIATGTSGRFEWRGGNGAGSGVITAPATAGTTAGGPGMYTINATLPPTSGGSVSGPERVRGSWMCS